MTLDPARASPPQVLSLGEGGDARVIAYRAFAGRAPSLLWLGGYGSDMLGAKAERFSALAAREGLGFCRFDYSGHGESGGRFADGTISRWTEEADAVLAAAVRGPAILVGSSMGAWIALRLLALRRERGEAPVAGLLLIAPAPDFTRRLVEPRLSAAQREDLAAKGFCTEPSAYSSEPTVYTRALIEDGARNLVMDGLIETGCPIRIVQGMADPDVPHTHALDLVAVLPGDDVVLTFVRDGDHRLSREADLLRLEQVALDLVAAARTA